MRELLGQYDMAESAHLEAYAVFDFGPEPRLLAFAPEEVARIDGLFWQGYNGELGLAVALAEGESAATVSEIRSTLDQALVQAQRTLGDLPTAPGAIITNTAIIVFREGFETALFLQALLLEAGAAIVLQGVLFGLLAVAAAGLATFYLQRRLPLKQMFIVTGLLIALVLVTMVGNTVHIMQKVGWLTLNPIQWLDVPYWMGLWLGIFPTWEGIGLQFAAAAFVIGSYFLAEAQSNRRRKRVRAMASAPS